MSARTRLVIFLAMLCLPAAPLLGQQTPEELLQSALYKQQIEGDLGGAIEILRALVNDFSEHRAVAARPSTTSTAHRPVRPDRSLRKTMRPPSGVQ